MRKGRYCFKVKHINWQNIRRDKQSDSKTSSVTKENKAEDSFLKNKNLP